MNQCLSFILNKYTSFPVFPQYKHHRVFIYIQCKEQYHWYNWITYGERMKLKHLFLNTSQCGVMTLHYSDAGEAPLAPICIPHEKQNQKQTKTKGPKFTFEKFYKPRGKKLTRLLYCVNFKTQLLHELQMKILNILQKSNNSCYVSIHP